MSLVKVSFDVEGKQQISRAFEATAAETEDMSEPLGEMADIIVGFVREQFDTEGAAGLGSKWQPLDPEYAAWKLAHYGPHPILVRQGGMKGAMLNKKTAVRVEPKRMIYEPKSRIAGYHQRGAGHLPARKMVALTTAIKRQAVDRVFSEWLNRIRRGPWWQTH